MAKQIVIDLVGDTKDFQRGMAQAEASTKSFEKATGKVSKQTEDLASSFSQVAGAVDDSESKFMGTADVLDGLATTMGLNVGSSIEMARGMADLAGGITNAVVPALSAGTSKVKSLSAAFLASPHAKMKLGLLGVGAAAVAMASQTDGGSRAVKGFSDNFKLGIRTIGLGIDKLGEWTGLLGEKAEPDLYSFENRMKETEFTANTVREAMKGLGQETLNLGDFASAQAGIISTMSNSFGDLAERIYTAQVSLYELYKMNGKFLSQAEANKALRIHGPYTASQYETPFMPAPKSPSEYAADAKAAANRARSGANAAAKNAAKTATDAAKKAADALKSAFEKVKPRLESALKTFQEKMEKATSMRDAFKSMFNLNFSDDIGHNVIESVRRQVQKWESFVKKLASLRKMGLRESLVRQFASAGPDALEQMQRINSGNLAEINKLAKKGEGIASDFARAETIRQTGTDPNKPIPVKLTLDVKGDDLKNLIKKWVRTEGGGDVQVTFGKGKKR